MAFSANAQNNPQKINDRLYPLYVRAYNLRKQADCLPVADSLRRAAIAIGDRNGELNALVVPFLHEFYKKNNMKGVMRTIKPLAEQAKEYKMWDMYYYAVSNLTTYYMREHRYIEAFMYQREQTEFARRNGHKSGIRLGYYMQGKIQQYRYELSQAINCFREAINYARKNMNGYGLVNEYISISDCFRMMCDYDNMKLAADTALTFAKTQAETNAAQRSVCYASFMLGRYGDFLRTFEYTNSHKASVENPSAVISLALNTMKAIYDGNDAEAWRGINDMARLSGDESKRLAVAYYKFHNDYAKCVDVMQQLLALHYEQSLKIFNYDNISKDAIFRDQHLEVERQRIIRRNTMLQLSNAQMELNNSSLELGRSRDAARLARAEADRNVLSYNHQQLLARQLSDSIAAQRIVQRTKERKMRMERFVLVAMSVMSVLAFALTAAYSLRRRWLVRKLRIANGRLGRGIVSLDEAKNRAQESERMKTLFIQNMGNDVRTPLNVIVATAKRLGNGQADAATMDAMAKQIGSSSDLLTAIVNNILEITRQESQNHNTKSADTTTKDN